MLATDLELFGMLKGRVLLLSSLNWGGNQRAEVSIRLIVHYSHDIRLKLLFQILRALATKILGTAANAMS